MYIESTCIFSEERLYEGANPYRYSNNQGIEGKNFLTEKKKKQDSSSDNSDSNTDEEEEEVQFYEGSITDVWYVGEARKN